MPYTFLTLPFVSLFFLSLYAALRSIDERHPVYENGTSASKVLRHSYIGKPSSLFEVFGS
ncbi:hypothetical protein [Aquimarina longa]|uniref:hypothetical protein n=1 Tax=Aquimarina longa TaxID=1080221 RepID=UPI00130D5357|nr:hypothetical protein [Aquimarina longa]